MFPPEMCKDIRKAFEAGVPAQRRETTFSGTYGPNAPQGVVGPAAKPMGRLMVRPYCQSCGEYVDGVEVIAFEYDFYPNDGRTCPSTWYLHKESCTHIGMGVPK